MSSISNVVGGVDLKVPVVIASGTWSYEEGMWQEDLTRNVGAICSKAITRRPWPGNPGTRVWETPSGILNSIGLQNEGIDRFMDVRLDQLKKHGVPIMLNVSMENAEDLDYMVARIAERAGEVDGIELNVSCLDIDRSVFRFHACDGNISIFALDADAFEFLVRAEHYHVRTWILS